MQKLRRPIRNDKISPNSLVSQFVIMPHDNNSFLSVAETESKFCFFGHFLNREFIGQKALNDDNEKVIAGESMEEVFDCLWSWSLQFVKREVLVDGDDFTWAELEKPTRPEIEIFLVLQDQGSKKNIPLMQVTSD